MWVNDLEELIETHKSNVLKLVEAETGFSIDESTPVTLIETLEAKLQTAFSDGVCYADINFIRNITELEPLTKYLNPTQFSIVCSFLGLNEYTMILMAGIKILKP